jgi:hypothetical protein
VYTPPAPVDDEAADPLRALVRQLSCSITIAKARAGLEALTPDQRAKIAPFVFNYISHFFVGPDGRDIALKIIASVPPIAEPRQVKDQDSAKAALVAARVSVVAKGANALGFAKSAVPTVPIKEIDETKVCPRCPEVFVADDEFEKWAGLTKKALYHGEPGQIAKVRSALLSRRPFR